jgi:DNA polymerase alpha subunit A
LGKMHYEYTEKMMYNQLLYFASLWDVEKAKTKAKGQDRGESSSNDMRVCLY